VSGGTLGSWQEWEELTLSFDGELEIEMVDHIGVVLDLFGSTDGFGRGRGDKTEEYERLGIHDDGGGTGS